MKYCNYAKTGDCSICEKYKKCVRHHEKHINRKVTKSIRKAISSNYIGDARNARPKEL